MTTSSDLKLQSGSLQCRWSWEFEAAVTRLRGIQTAYRHRRPTHQVGDSPLQPSASGGIESRETIQSSVVGFDIHYLDLEGISVDIASERLNSKS